MVTVKDGKLYGTVEIPVQNAKISDILRYVDFSDYSYSEIAEMLNSNEPSIKHMMYLNRKDGYNVGYRLPRRGRNV